MTGTWAFALLHQGEESAQGLWGEFCAGRGEVVRGQVSGGHGDAEPHAVAVGHHDVARSLGGMADGEDPETPPEERVGRVSHQDLFGVGGRWVLEGGTMIPT